MLGVVVEFQQIVFGHAIASVVLVMVGAVCVLFACTSWQATTG